MLAAKLRQSIVYPARELPASAVRFNTCFAYTTDGDRWEASLLVQYPPSGLPPFALSIYTLHGLALIGLRVGEAITIEVSDGSLQVLELKQIIRQPTGESF
ncbi:hypothetical protein HNS03_20940 [Amorphus sp. 3PC139-8]